MIKALVKGYVMVCNVMIISAPNGAENNTEKINENIGHAVREEAERVGE